MVVRQQSDVSRGNGNGNGYNPDDYGLSQEKQLAALEKELNRHLEEPPDTDPLETISKTVKKLTFGEMVDLIRQVTSKKKELDAQTLWDWATNYKKIEPDNTVKALPVPKTEESE